MSKHNIKFWNSFWFGKWTINNRFIIHFKYDLQKIHECSIELLVKNAQALASFVSGFLCAVTFLAFIKYPFPSRRTIPAPKIPSLKLLHPHLFWTSQVVVYSNWNQCLGWWTLCCVLFPAWFRIIDHSWRYCRHCTMDIAGGVLIHSQTLSFRIFQMHKRVIANMFLVSIGRISSKEKIKLAAESDLRIWRLMMSHKPATSQNTVNLKKKTCHSFSMSVCNIHKGMWIGLLSAGDVFLLGGNL